MFGGIYFGGAYFGQTYLTYYYHLARLVRATTRTLQGLRSTKRTV